MYCRHQPYRHRPLFDASQVLHGVEHKYDGHRIGVVAGRVFGRRRRVAESATTVAVDRVGVFAQLLAALGVRLLDLVIVHPAAGARVIVHLCGAMRFICYYSAYVVDAGLQITLSVANGLYGFLVSQLTERVFTSENNSFRP